MADEACGISPTKPYNAVMGNVLSENLLAMSKLPLTSGS